MPDPALLLFGPGIAFVFIGGFVSGYRPKPFPEWRVLVGGFAVFVGFVLHEHAISAGLLPWTVRIEPLGMLLLNGCLGYIAASRFFSTQRQLIAVEKEMDAARQIPCGGIAYPIADADIPFDSGQLGTQGVPTAGHIEWSTPTELPPGTYTYFCRIHPFMRGGFVVVAD